MLFNKREQDLYERILREKISAVNLKRWPFNYDCGNWGKHKPDKKGRQYFIHLNKTRGVECMKVTLFHELVHIHDDLEGTERSDVDTEDRALAFCNKNKEYVDYVWRKYILNSPPAYYN